MNKLEELLIARGALWKGKNARKAYLVSKIDKLKEQAREECNPAQRMALKRSLSYEVRKLEYLGK